jgi:KipI family sensor histidine kinase inhibitor
MAGMNEERDGPTEAASGQSAGDPVWLAISPLAESALQVVLGDRIDPAINARALALAAAVDVAGLPGVLDVVPSYATVLVAFDPERTDGDALAAAIRSLADDLSAAEPPPGRTVEIPVRYGGVGGPDLADVAAHAKLPAATVVARHAAAEYRVACMGFCPGFAFLLGLPPELATPRRASPRTRVPVGSVAIGGAQTGVYPLETPGGWNVIGHTDLTLFDPSRAEPILLRPGDRVRFVAVEVGAGATGGTPGGPPGNESPGYANDAPPGLSTNGPAPRPWCHPANAPTNLAPRQPSRGHGDPPSSTPEGFRSRSPGIHPRAVAADRVDALNPSTALVSSPPVRPHDRPAPPPPAAADRADAPNPAAALVSAAPRPSPPPPPAAGARALDILAAPGIATVQDLGRPGQMRLGVTPGGALDGRALVLGNRLLGNDPGAAVRFVADTLAVVSGVDFGPRLNGADISPWTPFFARAGAVLSFDRPAQPGAGLRCYLCVEGGVAVEPVMGSRATDLFGRFGGLEGRPLRAGDRLPLGLAHAMGERDAALRRRLVARPPAPLGNGPLRVVFGPHEARFGKAALSAFLAGRFVVDARSDRMGLRLVGPPLPPDPGPEMISEGIAAGAVQVPPDGQPILLTPARQTIGGYPRIATVVGADLPRLGQLAPGDGVRFAAVDLATARRLTLAAGAALDPDAVRELARAVVLAPGLAASALGMDEPVLRRLAEEARAAGVTGVAIDGPGVEVRLATRPALAPPQAVGARPQRGAG